eukprot:10390826-Karenia_brevis.AAC.1
MWRRPERNLQLLPGLIFREREVSDVFIVGEVAADDQRQTGGAMSFTTLCQGHLTTTISAGHAGERALFRR